VNPFRFFLACLRELTRGGRAYWTTLALLALPIALGAHAYATQLRHGLAVTGMGDEVLWGVYIANFAYLVGIAAAAVMLVIPAYIFHQREAKRLVLIAEGVAVAACLMALLFVVVDLGHPERALLLLPGLGSLNLPGSLLAWDVLVVPGYFALNLVVPAIVLYHRYHGRPAPERWLFPVVVVTMFWAVALHTVTAFLFSSDVARPFWHTALLGPRFLASAFASGPAFLIIVLLIAYWRTGLDVPPGVVRLLATIATVALQVNLVMLAAEAFNELYRPTEHSISAVYLFFGLGEADNLVPWIRASIAMQLVAVVVLMIEPLRNRTPTLLVACALTAIGVWIEKGMGLIIPGFVPTPLGEVVEYAPTAVEIQISFGIWALGALAFLLLAKVAIAIDQGRVAAPARVPT
jgi:molybdopterin-containing oxidoreductase family membrane subunit